MSVGTCSMTVALSGSPATRQPGAIPLPTLVGTVAGDDGSLALFLLQQRGARFIANMNSTLATGLAASPTNPAFLNVLNGTLASAKSMAAQLAQQCEDDAQLVTYFQQNATATLPAKSVDGANPVSPVVLKIG